MHDDVIEAGGDVKIFSSMHVSGERELILRLFLKFFIFTNSFSILQNSLSSPASLRFCVFQCQNLKMSRMRMAMSQIDNNSL